MSKLKLMSVMGMKMKALSRALLTSVGLASTTGLALRPSRLAPPPEVVPENATKADRAAIMNENMARIARALFAKLLVGVARLVTSRFSGWS